MKHLSLLVLVILLGMGVSLTGCGSKKAQPAPATEIAETEGELTPDLTPAEWTYEVAPNPELNGSPDYRLVSFGFDRESVLMKTEAKGACREALSQLADKPNTQLAVIGFADGIHEKKSAVSLGMRRAHSVSTFLKTLGIAKEQMQVTSFGDAYSTARDFETIKQSRERKVEIWVLQ